MKAMKAAAKAAMKAMKAVNAPATEGDVMVKPMKAAKAPAAAGEVVVKPMKAAKAPAAKRKAVANDLGEVTKAMKGGNDLLKPMKSKKSKSAASKAGSKQKARKKPAVNITDFDLEDAILGPHGLVSDSDSDGEASVDLSDAALMSELDWASHKDESDGDELFDDDCEAAVPPLLIVLRKCLKAMDSTTFSQLCENWRALSQLSAKTPLGSASGCTGSGMDWYTLKLATEATCSLLQVMCITAIPITCVCLSFLISSATQALHEVTGHTVQWENILEVEADRKKRRWLSAFSAPGVLGTDVTQLDEDFVTNDASGKLEPVPVPLNCFIYSFGYSCKDLSTLNNFSGEYRDNCLTTGKGSSGRTWQGNLQYLRRAKPFITLIENVRAARSGENYKRMKLDLESAGYQLADMILNSLEAGFPQDRVRAWFCAARRDVCPGDVGEWGETFLKVAEMIKIPAAEILPLESFIFKADHPYVKKVMAGKKLRVSKFEQNIGKKDTKKSLKWKSDHWRMRRMLNLPGAPTERSCSLEMAAIETGLGSRERDLLHIINEGVRRSSPTTELKHSAERVVLHAAAKHKTSSASTSCLLPASNIAIWPPLVPRVRLLVGLEALAIQGVPPCYHNMTGGILSDNDYMSLAGNAFSGGCCGLVLLAALATLRFPSS